MSDRLVVALDKAAIRFLEILDKGAIDPETTKPYPLKVQREVFDLAQSWLAKRARFSLPDDDPTPVAIREMKAAMKDAAKEVIAEEGVVTMPVSTRSRGGKTGSVQMRNNRIKRSAGNGSSYKGAANKAPGKPDDTALQREIDRALKRKPPRETDA